MWHGPREDLGGSFWTWYHGRPGFSLAIRWCGSLLTSSLQGIRDSSSRRTQPCWEWSWGLQQTDQEPGIGTELLWGDPVRRSSQRGPYRRGLRGGHREVRTPKISCSLPCTTHWGEWVSCQGGAPWGLCSPGPDNRKFYFVSLKIHLTQLSCKKRK
jgi:hypothetical protein